MFSVSGTLSACSSIKALQLRPRRRTVLGKLETSADIYSASSRNGGLHTTKQAHEIPAGNVTKCGSTTVNTARIPAGPRNVVAGH